MSAPEGTVFELAAGSRNITTLAINLAGPNALILDDNGNLYGTTNGGGASNGGTVFELAAGSRTITTLASFDGTNAIRPNTLILDARGNLFGTFLAGKFGYGSGVFELPAGSGTITTLASPIGGGGQDRGQLRLNSRAPGVWCVHS